MLHGRELQQNQVSQFTRGNLTVCFTDEEPWAQTDDLTYPSFVANE